MPKCFVPHCRSGYDPKKKWSQDGRKISFFLPPKDPDLFVKWAKAIPRSDFPLKRKSSICSLHFQDDQIERFYEIVINNEVQRVPRGKAKLVDGAVPSLNTNCPKNMSKVKKRSPPKERRTKASKPVHSVNSSPGISSEIENSDSVIEFKEQQDHSSFGQDLELTIGYLKTIPLPNESWASTVVIGKGIVFQEFTPDLKDVERRIVVYTNLNAKVWIKRTHVNIEGYENVTSLERLLSLLRIVSGMKICRYQDTRPFKYECLGVVDKVGHVCPPCKEKEKISRAKKIRIL